MIIKVKGDLISPNETHKNAKPNVKWWMYDNIVKLSHCIRQIDINDPNYHDVCITPYPINETGYTDFIIIIARDKNDNQFSIKTNSIVYILNDDGKTIEKLSID